LIPPQERKCAFLGGRTVKPESRTQLSESNLNALRKRRRDLLSRLGQGIAVLPAAKPNSGPAGDRATYRQDSDFLYLTGCPEPHALAVFIPQHPEFQTVLFVRERDAFTELWNGPMMGTQEAAEVLGFDKVFPISDFEKKLPEWLVHADTIYWDSSPEQEFFEQLRPLLQGSRLRRNGGEIFNVRDLIHEQRLFKDEFEIAALRKANAIASAAHEAAMRFARPGVTEYQVQAVLEASMRGVGSSQLGYPSIVAGGANACCLHYNTNTCGINADELLLIDAGCEWNYYTADVTRTFPVSGRFSCEQRALYDLVLSAQLQSIAAIRPGIKLTDLNDLAGRVLAQGLIDLGVIRASLDEVLAKKMHKEFFPHGLGHWLGMDVHDVGRYRIKNVERSLEPGMCLTIEPGIYVQPGMSGVDKRWHGIGIRIEDNILVTESGSENFTPCVKSTADVESMVGSMPDSVREFFLGR
jgi:Xaa-Pro aminopeptidase